MGFEDVIFEEMNGHSVEEDKIFVKGYNQALDEVDDIITEQLDKSDNQIECQTLRWVLDVLSDLIK